MTPLIESIIILAAKYGPEFALKLVGLLKKETVTLDDVANLFANVKPYEAYGIPDVVPVPPPFPPAIVAPTPTA